MTFKILTQAVINKLIEVLSPRFLGRDQDHLLAFGDEIANAGFDRAYDYIEPLQDFDASLQSNAGATIIHTTSGQSVQQVLDALSGGTLTVNWGSIGGTLSAQTDLQNALNLKAPLASPTFTGTPAAPTPATADNSTKLATTAYVKAQGYSTTTGTVTSVAATGSTGLTVGGSPVTTSDTLTFTLSDNLQAWSGIAPSSKQDALGYTPVNKAGDIMSGPLVAGSVSATGAGAALYTYDRTSGRAWAWYGTGDTLNLYNGSSNVLTISPSMLPMSITANGLSCGNAYFGKWATGTATYHGLMTVTGEYMIMSNANATDKTTYISAQTGGNVRIVPDGNNTAVMYHQGIAIGHQFTGGMYQLSADGSEWVRMPRVFVQSSDPGADAQDGDLWFW